MRSITFLTPALAVTLLAAGFTAQQGSADTRKGFAGTWKLVKYESFPADGAAPARGYDTGRITYDAQGNMTAQLSRNDRPIITQQSTDKERVAASQGYVAYYGTYDVDPVQKKVTHHVQGSTNTAWPGTNLVRDYEFSSDGQRLTLSIRNGDRVTSKLTWERMK